MPLNVTIIDLEIQNILSVQNAFHTIGIQTNIARNTREARTSQFLVLPGVGAYGAAVAKLQTTGLGSLIQDHTSKDLPLIGMCLGMQLLFDGSDEYGEHKGLGILPGRARKLQELPPDFRVPNIGWREVVLSHTISWLSPALNHRAFYHVHSFHVECDRPEQVVGTSEFGRQNIVSMVAQNNIFATQFHPEKSQEAGLDLLHAVVEQLTLPKESST